MYIYITFFLLAAVTLACYFQHESVNSSLLTHHCPAAVAHVRGIKSKWPLCDPMIAALNIMRCPEALGAKDTR